jgi:protein-L-isoaspartate(D-aspartate) O-methyltransferase
MRCWPIVFFLMTLLLSPADAQISRTASDDGYAEARRSMVEKDIRARGISDPGVLDAMLAVPRHRFVPGYLKSLAYADRPLPIGEGQTISQPYIVALMTEALKLKPDAKVLEIGTGSGYQAAVLSKVAASVVTIEIKEKLHRRAAALLKAQGHLNVAAHHGDGYFGWQAEAPYDAIMITAAVDHVPPPLLKQLKDGGRLVLPLGNPFSYQNLVLVTRTGEDTVVRQITGVLFVPMTGAALEKQPPAQ